ncbi:hypothetical protein U1Q18_032590 [Sarracenia purpurea var. burkii]
MCIYMIISIVGIKHRAREKALRVSNPHPVPDPHRRAPISGDTIIGPLRLHSPSSNLVQHLPASSSAMSASHLPSSNAPSMSPLLDRRPKSPIRLHRAVNGAPPSPPVTA